MGAAVALVAGAVGRRGEALLNRVLGCGEYAKVVVLAQAPISLGVHNLEPAALDALPRVDDAFIALCEPGEPASRSFYGRDACFELVHSANLLAVARAAVGRGATRLVLISPMPAWQQIGDFHRGLGDAIELEVSRLPLASLVVLRPVREAKRTGRRLLERIAGVYLSLQLLMLPGSVQQLTSEQLARAALAAMRDPAGGVRVFTSDRLASLIAIPR